MKRWAVLTVAMYALILLLLAGPAIFAVRMKWHPAPEPARWAPETSWDQALRCYEQEGLWIVVGVLAAAQAVLLLVPVGVAERRPISRRKVLLSVALGSFLLTLLLAAGALSISAAADGDDSLAWVEDLAEEHAKGPILGPVLEAVGLRPGSDVVVQAYVFGTIVLAWLAWTLVFLRFAKRDAPEDLVRRMTRWLLRGSVLELLVAVPSHVIVRRRDECCAPAVSSAGILTGMSVMLLAFGPGVYFLFVERMRRLRPDRTTEAGTGTADRIAPPPPETP